MIPLPTLPPGQWANVIALQSQNPARLDRLSAFGLMPGCPVQLVQNQPTFILRVGETELALDHEVAAEIWVHAA